jgi:membrane protease YdiL (CAAX protease family)
MVATDTEAVRVRESGPLITAWVAVVGLAGGLPATIAIWSGWPAGALALPPASAAVLFLGWALRNTTHALRPAGPLLLVLAASVLGLWLITLIVTTDAVREWLASAPVAMQIAVVNGLKIIPLALAGVAVFCQRPHRAFVALRMGDWRAASGLRLRGRDIGWQWIGPLTGIVLVGGILVSGLGSLTSHGLGSAVSWLPLCAAVAVVNSAAEEFQFRHAVNAFARPLMGPIATIALTSSYFGVTHINGTPSGLSGVVLSGAFGVVLATAIDRTRGFCWNWTLHFLADLAIFSTLVAITPSG